MLDKFFMKMLDTQAYSITKAELKRVKKGWYGVLNYFRYRITNGLSEPLNNRIATLQKKAYGFRNFEYFILKVYQ